MKLLIAYSTNLSFVEENDAALSANVLRYKKKKEEEKGKATRFVRKVLKIRD